MVVVVYGNRIGDDVRSARLSLLYHIFMLGDLVDASRDDDLTDLTGLTRPIYFLSRQCRHGMACRAGMAPDLAGAW